MLRHCLSILSDEKMTADTPQNAYRKQSRDKKNHPSTFGICTVDVVLANECEEQACEASEFKRE